MLLETELCVRDETAFGDSLAEVYLSFDQKSITVKDIISERVRTEVSRLNRSKGSDQDIDHLLLKYGIEINEEHAIEEALAAFESNHYFVLLDNVQVDSLDQAVHLYETQTASFVKLTPLVGG